jgi:predicted outer membrane repeat protein
MCRMNDLYRMLFATVALAISSATASAETITVCSSGCDYTSINAAIEAAADEGDVIEIGSGVWRENLGTNKQLVLRGAGPDLTIIDGSDGPIGWSTCLIVSEDFDGWKTQERFRVESLTLRGGSGAEIFGLIRGGGVYIEFAPVTLSNVVIEDCSIETLGEFSTEGLGGAICNFFGDVAVESCVLRRNSSFTLGGAIYTDGPLRIFDTLIEGNIGEVEGGAIFSAHGDVRIEQSTICGNSSDQIFGGYLDLGGNTISSDCPTPACSTDFDGDGITDGADLGRFFLPWGECIDCASDLDGDGNVDAADLGLLLGAWGPCQ